MCPHTECASLPMGPICKVLSNFLWWVSRVSSFRRMCTGLYLRMYGSGTSWESQRVCVKSQGSKQQHGPLKQISLKSGDHTACDCMLELKLAWLNLHPRGLLGPSCLPALGTSQSQLAMYCASLCNQGRYVCTGKRMLQGLCMSRSVCVCVL